MSKWIKAPPRASVEVVDVPHGNAEAAIRATQAGHPVKVTSAGAPAPIVVDDPLDDPMMELPNEDPSEQPVSEQAQVQTEIPEESLTESELEILQREVKDAVQAVLKLEGQESTGRRLFSEATEALPGAKAKRDALINKLQRLKPTPLPPLPSREEMIAMARQVRPDADDRETLYLAQWMHAQCSDGMARQSERYYNAPPPTMTGPEVREEGQTKYDIPRQPRERKSYG